MSLELAAKLLAAVFFIYTLLAAGHFILQLWFAYRLYRRQAGAAFARLYPPNALDVDVIVPVYNEAPDDLDACIRSILAQRHLGSVHLIVVDDGSRNRAALEPIYASARAAGATVLMAPHNGGKRQAQYLGFQALRGQIVVTVDSDTQLAPDAVAMLTRQFVDPRVGAVTGDVRVSNARRNLLTRLIGLRYWLAFHQERAAQAWFRTVLCASGPLAAYRREIIEQVMDRYISQTFRGARCTYGDDRHLTNLVLEAGYDSLFDGAARAWTSVPESIPTYLRQQLRWNKSFYRELLWTTPYLLRRPAYMTFDVVVQTLLPLMLSLSLLGALAYSVVDSPAHLGRYALMVLGIAVVRASYGVIREHRAEFYLFTLYGFLHVALLIPTRAFALATLRNNGWGTR